MMRYQLIIGGKKPHYSAKTIWQRFSSKKRKKNSPLSHLRLSLSLSLSHLTKRTTPTLLKRTNTHSAGKQPLNPHRQSTPFDPRSFSSFDSPFASWVSAFHGLIWGLGLCTSFPSWVSSFSRTAFHGLIWRKGGIP
jgi:hypothetical protein